MTKGKTSSMLKWEDQDVIINYFNGIGRHDLSLLVFLSFHTGMRIGNILQLRWNNIYNKNSITFEELRSHNVRTIELSKDIKNFVSSTYFKLGKPSLIQYCFVSQKGSIYTVQRINVLLKEAAIKCGLKDANISTHSLRKAFGREVYKRFGEKSLYFLRDFFSQPSIKFTIEYLSLPYKNRLADMGSL